MTRYDVHPVTLLEVSWNAPSKIQEVDMLPKISKKIILFCSSESPFWHKHLPKVTRLEIKQVIGISPTTMIKWESGGIVNRERLHEIFFQKKETKTKINKKPNEFEKNLANRLCDNSILKNKNIKNIERKMKEIYDAMIDDSIDLYQFGETLDYDVTGVQKAIDQEIYKRTPVFRDIYYSESNESRALAQSHFKAFGGFYSVYIERKNKVLRASMRIRYVLQIHHLQSLRIKLNLPSPFSKTGEQTKYLEYDGFLSVKPVNIFWMLEERYNLSADFFHMITDRPDMLESKKHPEGHYLTTTRGEKREIVNGRIILVRENISVEDRTKFMHEGPEIIENNFDQEREKLFN